MIHIYSVSNSQWDNFLVCAPKRHTENFLESKRKIKSCEFSVKWAYVPFGCTHIFFLFHFYLAPISSFSYPKTHALVRLVSDDTQSLNWSTMKFFYPFILKILVEFSIENSAVSPNFFFTRLNMYIMCLMCAYHVWFQNMVFHYKSYCRVENV